MENDIPTAEEFYTNFVIEHKSDSKTLDLMIEFAKLHVQAALKEASEKAKIKYEYSGNTGSEYCDEYVDHNSILNAYPLTNIK
jgi:hypothetical protein